jgi:hypothetical protein
MCEWFDFQSPIIGIKLPHTSISKLFKCTLTCHYLSINWGWNSINWLSINIKRNLNWFFVKVYQEVPPCKFLSLRICWAKHISLRPSSLKIDVRKFLFTDKICPCWKFSTIFMIYMEKFLNKSQFKSGHLRNSFVLFKLLCFFPMNTAAPAAKNEGNFNVVSSR